MFKKVLVANRGDIALRIIRACRELGVPTVIVYSEADRDSLPVAAADEAICIGPAAASRSYLNIPNVVSAALVSGADALHPGYGFLAENPYVAEICAQCGITFIGPSPSVMEVMSDKAEARRLMHEAGLPLVAGTGPVATLADAREAADEIGYPVMLKAVAGGGGRGLRPVWSEAELAQAYPVAQGEAANSFSNPQLYMESFLDRPRHIEVQVLLDGYGNAVYLGERECSLQRRHQKVIEESPCASLTAAQRGRLGELALRGAQHVGYTNAGTMEFLLDGDGRFYFMEMNTRIQVEHPVTEMVTGIDLVKWQILIAAGERLSFSQTDVRLNGHAVECRITAEDATRGFAPVAGRVDEYLPPGGPGIRVDSHLRSGAEVPSYYDSLLAKLIAWGGDRAEALSRARRALAEFHISGLQTNIGFLRSILKDSNVEQGRIHTGFIEQWLADNNGWENGDE